MSNVYVCDKCQKMVSVVLNLEEIKERFWWCFYMLGGKSRKTAKITCYIAEEGKSVWFNFEYIFLVVCRTIFDFLTDRV